MSAITDLATVALWPLVAITLVLCGMTLASSGHGASATAERRASASTPGGRRATDGLPGDRVMVVVTGESSAATIDAAITSARGGDTPATVAGRAARASTSWTV